MEDSEQIQGQTLISEGKQEVETPSSNPEAIPIETLIEAIQTSSPTIVASIPPKFYRIEREKSYVKVSEDFLSNHALIYDSDVFEYTSETPSAKGIQGDVTLKQISANKNCYKINSDFKDAKAIDEHLRFWGKIPPFLELRDTPDKGYGIFTKNDILPKTFLGFYQGNVRIECADSKNTYLFACKDFSGKVIGKIDAENITFSNWTRFVNDSIEPVNIDYIEHNFQVYAVTNRYIKAEEQLFGSYGSSYWEFFGGKK